MLFLRRYKLVLSCAPFLVWLLLPGCGTVEPVKPVKSKPIKSKPAIEKEHVKQEKKKLVPRDISKLSLEEIHNLPRYRECRRLLKRADQELKKRPTVPVRINAFKGLSEMVDLGKMFYLEPEAEQYPLDDSIRHYKCPKNIEDVKVYYHLKKGTAYASWYYYSYEGKEKGIDTLSAINPQGLIESRFGSKPPSVALQIDKMKIISLHPSRTISNKDIEFILEDVAFDSEKHISFDIYNKSDSDVVIRDVKFTLGPFNFHANLDGKFVKVAPQKRYIKTGVEAGFNKKTWFVKDSARPVRLSAKIIYQKKGQFKLLSTDLYLKLLDFGINQKLK